MYNAIATLQDKPFIFFGHSIGAHLAWALSRELGTRGLPQPRRILVSGASPLAAGTTTAAAAVAAAAAAAPAAMAESWRSKLNADGTLPPALQADLEVLRGLAKKAAAVASKGAGTGAAVAGQQHADFTCPITAFGAVEEGALCRSWGGCTTVSVCNSPQCGDAPAVCITSSDSSSTSTCRRVLFCCSIATTCT